VSVYDPLLCNFNTIIAEFYVVAGSDCDDLLELLHGLPLALAQAGSYLRETGVDIATYVRIYNEQWAELMGPCDASSRPLVDYNQGSVRTTWTISFKEIERQSANAAKLLRLWAFLDNKQLWHGLLAVTADDGGLQDRWPDWVSEMGSNVVRFLDAVRVLLRYSMIETEEGSKDSYSMHPVVHRWALCLDGQQQKNEWAKLALEVVGHSVPFQDAKEYWLLQQRLLPHAERCLWWIRENVLSLNECSFRDPPIIDSLHSLGILFADRGKLREAEEMYDRALKGHEATLGPDHTSTLKIVQNVGNLYKVQGKHQEAEKMYDRALKGYKRLGCYHRTTLEIANNLGTVYADQGKLREAEKTFGRALQGYETTPGPDSVNTSILDTFNNLGCLYRIQGELQKAGMMYDRALEGYKNRLGHQHTWTLRTINNLGVLYADQDMFQEAEEKYSQALQGYKTTLGTNHMSTLNVASNLGHVYSKQGKLQKAEEMYNQALAGYENTLGRHHTSTVEIVEHLGSLYANQGRLRKAEEMYQRALDGYEKALERDHLKISQVRSNIKSLQHAQGTPTLPSCAACSDRIHSRFHELGRREQVSGQVEGFWEGKGKVPQAD
jgi:tetratricopeptide (TPR) repeat protein